MNIVFLDANTIGNDINLEVFKKYGHLEVFEFTNENQINKRLKNADIVITNKCKLNNETLKETKVKLICLTATGYDNVDIDYCKAKKIAVCNVGGYSTNSVVQHTFTMLLALEEKLFQFNDYVKSKEYIDDKSFKHLSYTFNEIYGKVFGIVGMGQIGRAVAKVAESFGCKVVYWSSKNEDRDKNYERVDFRKLLEISDIISIHAPLNNATLNLFNLEAFKKMKKNSILLNVGRGKIVNESDLVYAIKNNLIKAAGLDVLGIEPIQDDNPYLEIIDYPNILITPHIAWAAVESRQRCIDFICKNIEHYLEGEILNRVDI